jgi:2'-5' RNA ligase
VDRAVGNAAARERLGFRLAWLVGSTRLRLSAGGGSHALPPSGADAASHHSVIIRLPESVAASVAPILERLREHGPHHYYYPADTIHVTVRVLEGSLPGGPDAAARFADLRTIVGSYPSFDLTLRGLNVSPTTVFAQVIPHDRTFGRLRGSLRRRLARRSSVSQPGSVSSLGGVVRDLLPHANVVRFSGGVTPNFLDEVSRSRQVRIGRWTVREVELVRTDRLLSREGAQVLERTPLAIP